MRPPVDLPVDDDSSADAGSPDHEEEVFVFSRDAMHRLPHRRGIRVILDENRKTECLAKSLENIDLLPLGEVRRIAHHPVGRYDPGRSDPDPEAARLCAAREEIPDRPDHLFEHRIGTLVSQGIRPGLFENLSLSIDDARLDRRGAQIDADRECFLPCHRGRPFHNLFNRSRIDFSIPLSDGR